MKATLEFNLPEDQTDFNQACDGAMLSILLWEIDQRLRGIVKHGSGTVDAQEIRDMIDVDWSRVE
jgi:hypothetical protein